MREFWIIRMLNHTMLKNKVKKLTVTVQPRACGEHYQDLEKLCWVQTTAWEASWSFHFSILLNPEALSALCTVIISLRIPNHFLAGTCQGVIVDRVMSVDLETNDRRQTGGQTVIQAEQLRSNNRCCQRYIYTAGQQA